MLTTQEALAREQVEDRMNTEYEDAALSPDFWDGLSTGFDTGWAGAMAALPVEVREVLEEVQREDAKWGEQNHPDGTGPDRRGLRDLATAYWKASVGGELDPAVMRNSVLCEIARIACKAKFALGQGTWKAVLLEEVFEALEQEDPVLLLEELNQVAAVALQWRAAVRRRQERS